MNKYFNVSGDCKPALHYMVNIHSKLTEIKKMTDRGEYFTINRARQYGKTTTLRALEQFLKDDYLVISLDFQMMSHTDFQSEQAFAAAFSDELLDCIQDIPQEIRQKLILFTDNSKSSITLSGLFRVLSRWCAQSPKPVVLIIDEADSFTNNQVFIDFLSQLRGYYISKDRRPAFHSVILASVYNIKNIRQRFRTDEEHRDNSPWNIAADFLVDMSFSAKEIAGMLEDYEHDHHTDMDIEKISGLLYAYTSGYPFLVSRLCKRMDERVSAAAGSLSSAWTKEGFLTTVRILLAESNTLFDSLIHKLREYPELDKMLRSLLFAGK